MLVGRNTGDRSSIFVNLKSIVRKLRHSRQSAEQARNHDRIHALRKWIGADLVGAELGVHKGYFSRIIMDQLHPSKLFLVDSWYLVAGREWHWGDGNRNVIDGLCEVLHTMENELVSGRAVLVIDEDISALHKMPDGSLDWAYIDTSHQYDHTMQELEVLKEKVKVGGAICGDDWREDPNHRHHGVCRAVREFLTREPGMRGPEIDYPSAQWLIQR
jgi:Methyltransferase domain